MTQEEKDIIIADLCERLPYGLIIKCNDGFRQSKEKLVSIDIGNGLINYDWRLTDIKPYLRPISDMTPEECEKLFDILHIDENRGDWLKINDIGIIRLITENGKDFYEIAQALYYLNSIHVDYNELIEKDLAKRALEGMYNH